MDSLFPSQVTRFFHYKGDTKSNVNAKITMFWYSEIVQIINEGWITMAQKLRLCIAVWMLLISSVSGVLAQPGGRTGGSGGGIPQVEIPNVEVPDIDEIDLDIKGDIDIDVASQQLLATVTARQGVTPDNLTFDRDTFSSIMQNYDVPDNWSEIDLTGAMPTSKEDIMAMIDDLPIDLDSLDIGLESSPQATSAIIGFASSMLGLNVTPLYAGQYGDSDLDSSEIAQETIDQVYSQLDGDMQALMSQADALSGITYWALLDNGMALLYTGDCELDQCSISQDRVQVEVTQGSAGAYAIYSDTVPASTADAKALVQQTYPYLAGIDLSETESSYGTAFFAFDIDMDTQQVTAYYAGVYATETGQSIVYAVAGVGDAYINMMLGGS